MINSLVAAICLAPAAIHIRVDGEGYFRFARGTQAVYSVDANLFNSNGLICSSDGLPLLPQTHLDPGSSFAVSLDGTVSCSGKQVGKIVLAAFPANALQKSGKYWVATTRSQIGFPGEGVMGVIRGVGAYSSPVEPASKTTVQPTIEISLKTDVDKPEILLGDIATVQGSKSLEEQIAGVDLGASPIFGAPRGITRVYVLAAMRHAGIDTNKLNLLCPQGAFVMRKSQKISSDALVSAAKDGVKQQLGTDEDLRETHPVGDLVAPSGEIAISTVQAVTMGDGYTVNVEVDVDGKLFCRRTVSLMPTNPVAHVHLGDPVKIRVLKNGASVEVQGKTRSNGKVGSTVSVETEAGASFTGTLISTSVVEVKL